MLKKLVKLILITLIPGLELRASIPYGFIAKGGPSWPIVVLTCVVANIILGIVTFLLLDLVVKLITRIKPLERAYAWYVRRTQKRIDAAVQKHGKWALAVFIGIPFPGTGAISGAVAAHLVGIGFRKFLWANVVGVLMAGVLVTTLCLMGAQTLPFLQKLFVHQPTPL